MAPCYLCPRMCGAEREKAPGFCGCGDTPRVARAAPHFWEEPCLSGTGGSGAIFFSGCNLRCAFCQNRPLCRGYAGTDIPAERLADICLELQEQGVHNINFVTPTPWTEHIRKALDLAWDKGLWIPAVYNCGGYERAETLASLRGYISIYLPDFKYMDASLGEKYSAARDYPETAKRALDEMVNQRGEPVFDEEGILQRGVIVRHLVLPHHAEDSMRVLDYLHSTYGDSIYISIMSQYTPMKDAPEELSSPLSAEEYKAVTDYAAEIGITRGFLQEGEAAKESFIPLWDGTGVKKEMEDHHDNSGAGKQQNLP